MLGSPWHWHAWSVGGGWPLVGLFWVALWMVSLALLFTALWRHRGSWPGGFSRHAPAGASPPGGAVGGPARMDRSVPIGTAGQPLRASSEEREATVRALSDALADGRLSSEECSERISAAYAARYRHELFGLTADLPPAKGPHPEEATGAPRPGPGRLGAPLARPLVVVPVLLVGLWAWHLGPTWLLLLLGIWLFVRARRRFGRPTLR